MKLFLLTGIHSHQSGCQVSSSLKIYYEKAYRFSSCSLFTDKVECNCHFLELSSIVYDIGELILLFFMQKYLICTGKTS
jgi:hypothetical protein